MQNSQTRLGVLAVVWLLISELAVAVALGFAGPSMTVMVALALVAPTALMIRADQLVLVTLGSLFFTRILVDFGAPSIMNYAHFALALLALIKLLEQRADESNSRLIAWLFISLVVVFVTSALSFWQAFRPMVAWLTFFEPFIFFGLVASLDEKMKKTVLHFLVFICLMQIPLALMQFASNGAGDFVQGTLVGQGAGHHVMGGVTTATGWFLLATATGKRSRGLILLGLVLIGVGVLADAKQVYGCLVAALLIAGVLQMKGANGAKSFLVPAVALVGTMFLISLIYPPMQRALTAEILEDAAGYKYETTERIISGMSVEESIIGLGAGNGLSRTALSTVPGYGNVPAILIGDDPAEMALRERQGYDAVLISSVDSPFSSWLGLYSDHGILGVLTFIMLAGCVWKSLKTSSDAHRRTSEMFLIFMAVLGIVFTWLEEPAFMVFLAALLATGVRPSADTGLKGRSAALRNLSRPWSSVRRSS